MHVANGNLVSIFLNCSFTSLTFTLALAVLMVSPSFQKDDDEIFNEKYEYICEPDQKHVRVSNINFLSLPIQKPGDAVKGGNSASMTNNFISAITKSAVVNELDIHPFFISRCRASVDMQISNLHNALQKLYQHVDLDAKIQEYTPKYIEEELPRWDKCYEVLYSEFDLKPLSITPAQHLISNLFQWVYNTSAPRDVALPNEKYEQLFFVVDTLAQSYFLKTLAERHTKAYDVRQSLNKICQLKQRLDKVCQLITNLAQFVDKVDARMGT